LHNLPSSTFDEVKSVELLPTLNQQEVTRQALERFQNKVNAYESEDVQAHNSMVDNMMMMDHTTQRYKEYRRKLNEHHQEFLRLQIRQKVEDKGIESDFKKRYQAAWDSALPEEKLSHLHRVAEVQRNQSVKLKMQQAIQRDYRSAIKTNEKNSVRDSERKRVERDLSEHVAQQREALERKRQLQEMNAKVWLD